MKKDRDEARLKKLKSGSIGPMNLALPPINTTGHTGIQAITILDKLLLKVTENVPPANAEDTNMAPTEVHQNRTAISENQECYGSHLKLLQTNP